MFKLSVSAVILAAAMATPSSYSAVYSRNFRDAGGDRKLTSAGGVTETVQMHNSRNTERKLFIFPYVTFTANYRATDRKLSPLSDLTSDLTTDLTSAPSDLNSAISRASGFISDLTDLGTSNSAAPAPPSAGAPRYYNPASNSFRDDGDRHLFYPRKLHFAGGESETVQSKNFRDAGGDRKLTSAGGVTETVQMHNSRNTERKLFYGDRKLTSAGGRLLLLVPTSRRWNLNFRDGDEERKLHFAGGESETVQSKNFRDDGDRHLFYPRKLHFVPQGESEAVYKNFRDDGDRK